MCLTGGGHGAVVVVVVIICCYDVYISYYNAESHSFNVERYSNTEPAYVDQVKMLFDDAGEKKCHVSDVASRSDRLQRIFIMLRIKVSQGRLVTLCYLFIVLQHVCGCFLCNLLLIFCPVEKICWIISD